MTTQAWKAAFCIGVLAFSGCGRERAEPQRMEAEPLARGKENGRTVVYECDQGFRFTARVDFERALILLPEGPANLRAVASASGAKYSDGKRTFWSKGDEAMLEAGDRTYQNCKADHKEAPWEDARLRGVEFRATGNEPGWHVEVFDGRGRFVLDYGEQQFETALHGPERDGRVSTYAGQHEGREVRMLVREEACADTATGQPFDRSVLVTVNGREYGGCGRVLE